MPNKQSTNHHHDQRKYEKMTPHHKKHQKTSKSVLVVELNSCKLIKRYIPTAFASFELNVLVMIPTKVQRSIYLEEAIEIIQ